MNKFEELMKFSPEVVLVFPDDLFVSQFDIWAPYLDSCGYRVCICAKKYTGKRTFKFKVFTEDNGFCIEHLEFIKTLKVLLYTTNRSRNFLYLKRFPTAKHIFLGHGDSEKHSSSSRYAKAYDYILVADIDAYMRYKINHIKVGINSFLFMGAPTFPGIERIKAKSDIKKILYAPTFEGKSDAVNYSSLLNIKNKLYSSKYEIFFRLHPGTGGRLPTFLEAKKELADYTKSNLIKDKTKQFNYSDALVTDISGIKNEYLFTMKPIIIPVQTTDTNLLSVINKYKINKYSYIWHYDTIEFDDFILSIRDDRLFEARKKFMIKKYKNTTTFNQSKHEFIKQIKQAIKGRSIFSTIKNLIQELFLFKTPRFLKKNSSIVFNDAIMNKNANDVSINGPQQIQSQATKCIKESSQSSEPCPICNTETNYQVLLFNKPNEIDAFQGEHHIYTCPKCFHIVNKENLEKELNPIDIKSSRVGTVSTPGREFLLAQASIPSLISHDCSVLVFGSGNSLDHMHIAKLPTVTSCNIADLNNSQNADNFIDFSSTKKFDLVIASEVIEHFESPVEHFKTLFDFVNDTGVIIAATNLNVPNSSLLNLKYPYTNGHCTYWSANSINIVSERNGFFCFFFNMKTGGPKKRIIFFTKNPEMIKKLTILSGEKEAFI